MKIEILLLLCLTALVNGRGHLYPSAPAPIHHRHVVHHHHQHPTHNAYFPRDLRPAHQQIPGSFDVTHNFRKLPLTPINSFHDLPPLVPVGQDYGGLGKQDQRPLTHGGPWTQATYQRHHQHWTSGHAAFGRPQASFGSPGSVDKVHTRPLTPLPYKQPLFPSSIPATQKPSLGPLPAYQRSQPFGPLPAYQRTQPLAAPSFGSHHKQPLGPLTTYQGPQPSVPASIPATQKQPLGPLPAYQRTQPFGPLPTYQRTQPLSATSFGVHQKQHLGLLATYQGQQPLAPTSFGGHSAGLVHQGSLGPLTTYHSPQPLAATAFGAPGSISAYQHPLTPRGPISSSAHKQPLTFQGPQSQVHATGFGTPFQKQPLAPSAAVHGQQAVVAGAKSAKGPPTPGPKKPFSFTYTANPTRKVVEVSPQRGVIAGTVPLPVVVQTASGPKYGTYHQPAALTYTYNATKVQYKPVEAHGYQVSY